MKLVVSAIAVLAIGGAANAGDLLWDQSPDTSLPAFVDQSFPDFPDFDTFLANDVTFGDAITINSITTYFTNLNLGWPQGGAGTAVLNIFEGPLETGDDPTAGSSVAVDYIVDGDSILVVASGLDIDLAAGTYWIGLTPSLEFGVNGQEFHQQAATSLGDPTQARNPGGGFGLGTEWFDAGAGFGGDPLYDAAITIEGTLIPAPGALALLGLAGLAGRRRRRA